LDSSALVKLIVKEPESQALLALAHGRGLVSSELALVEVPRAIRRLARGGSSTRVSLERGIERLFAAIGLLPLRREVLLRAGAFAAPWLRALDAIHLAAAIDIAEDVEAFVSYDARQGEAARYAGLAVLAPGAG
jgi:predicted nucleic acid-binding protein